MSPARTHCGIALCTENQWCQLRDGHRGDCRPVRIQSTYTFRRADPAKRGEVAERNLRAWRRNLQRVLLDLLRQHGGPGR